MLAQEKIFFEFLCGGQAESVLSVGKKGKYLCRRSVQAPHTPLDVPGEEKTDGVLLTLPFVRRQFAFRFLLTGNAPGHSLKRQREGVLLFRENRAALVGTVRNQACTGRQAGGKRTAERRSGFVRRGVCRILTGRTAAFNRRSQPLRGAVRQQHGPFPYRMVQLQP